MESDSKAAKILKQLIISLAIFIVALTISNLNTPFTNNVSSQITGVLTSDTEFNSVYNSIKQIVTSLNMTNERLKSVFSPQTGSITEQSDEPVVIPEEMKNKVTDAAQDKVREFVVPVGGIITSKFGERISPFSKKKEFHEGVDIDAKEGQEVKAILDGTVLESKKDPTLGNYLKVDHGEGLVAIYAHASALVAKEGQKIKKGEIILKAGNTGRSIGPHLHIEIRKGEKLVNPEELINFNKSLVDVK